MTLGEALKGSLFDLSSLPSFMATFVRLGISLSGADARDSSTPINSTTNNKNLNNFKILTLKS